MKSFLHSLYASRPFLWVNTAFPFVAGWVVSEGSFSWPFFIGTIFFLFPYNLAMYGINDIFDYESDIKNPRKASVEGAQLQKAELLKLWPFIILSTLPFIGYLVVTGTWVSTGMLVFSLFMVVAYSAVPFRFKEIAFLDSITSSFHFVTPFLFGILYAHGTLTPYSFVILAFFLWGMASHSFGAIQDITYDREANIGSIATVLGARRTIVFCTLLYLASALVLVIGSQNYVSYSVASIVVLFAFTTAGYYRVTDATAHKTNTGWHTFMALSMATGALLFTGYLYTHSILPWYGPLVIAAVTFVFFQKLLQK